MYVFVCVLYVLWCVFILCAKRVLRGVVGSGIYVCVFFCILHFLYVFALRICVIVFLCVRACYCLCFAHALGGWLLFCSFVCRVCFGVLYCNDACIFVCVLCVCV